MIFLVSGNEIKDECIKENGILIRLLVSQVNILEISNANGAMKSVKIIFTRENWNIQL